jgi:hypothetical protein
MSLFTQDLFAEARTLGLTDGFVGTFADLQQLVLEATLVDPNEDGFLVYERHLEDQGWADKFWEEDAMRTGAMGLPPLDLAFPELLAA